MKESETQFPGFQVLIPKDEYIPRRLLSSRLQRRAPRPLQLKPSVSFKCDGAPKAAIAFPRDHLSPSSTAMVTSLYQNHDPIPLLSPLVSPSSFAAPESSAYIRNENTTKSH